MKKIVTLLLIFYSLTLSAQVAGYMGKRFIVGYSNLFSPSISTIYTERYRSSSALKIQNITVSHVVDLNYVIHYRKALCFSVSYVVSKIPNASIVTDYYRFTFTKSDYNAKLSSLGFSFGIKLFKRSRLAPLGPYVKWEGLFLLNTIKFQPYSRTYWYYNSTTGSDSLVTKLYEAGQLNSKSFGAALSFGKQRVFFDKLVVDFGIRGALVATISEPYNYTHTEYVDELRIKSFDKIFNQQFVNLRLGIGFLAF